MRSITQAVVHFILQHLKQMRPSRNNQFHNRHNLERWRLSKRITVSNKLKSDKKEIIAEVMADTVLLFLNETMTLGDRRHQLLACYFDEKTRVLPRLRQTFQNCAW